METASKESDAPARALVTRTGPGVEAGVPLASDATNDFAGAMAQLRRQTAQMFRIILRSLQRKDTAIRARSRLNFSCRQGPGEWRSAQEQDDDHDEEDKGDAATTVVAESGAHAVAAKAEDKNKDD